MVSLKEQEQRTERTQTLVEGVVKVVAHRKLTFRNGDDYETLEGSVEFPETRDSALSALGEWLDRIDKLLAEKKRGLLATAKPPPAKAVQPTHGDDKYSRLPWKQSSKRAELCTIMVKDVTSDPVALQLYNELTKTEKKALRIGRITYRLSVTESGVEFLQRWT
jgi:hypothetical protein